MTAGSVRVLGRDVRGMSTHRVVELGVALVPEGRAVFGNLSVHENLLMGAFNRRDPRAVASEIDDIYQRFPNLAARRQHPQHARAHSLERTRGHGNFHARH